jgi:hypothetical protein
VARRVADSRLPHISGFLLRWSVRLRQLRLRIGGLRPWKADVAAPAVSGYWPDNWIEEKLEVVLDARESSRQFRIVGRPVARMTVEVSANGTRLGRFDLAADRQEVVALQLPPGPRETVSFFFSDHLVDVNGRRISFLLEETNAFSEEDLGAPLS